MYFNMHCNFLYINLNNKKLINFFGFSSENIIVYIKVLQRGSSVKIYNLRYFDNKYAFRSLSLATVLRNSFTVLYFILLGFGMASMSLSFFHVSINIKIIINVKRINNCYIYKYL